MVYLFSQRGEWIFMGTLIGIILVFCFAGFIFKILFGAIGFAFKLVFWILQGVFCLLGFIFGGGLLAVLGIAIVGSIIGIPILLFAGKR